MFLFALSFWLWKRGRDDAAGFVLAMGLFRPQLVLPFVLSGIPGGKVEIRSGFIPGAVFVLLVSIWVVGVHGMAEYVRILLSQGTQGSASALGRQWQVRPGLMPTLRGLLWIVLPRLGPRQYPQFPAAFRNIDWLAVGGQRMRGVKDGAAFDHGVCHGSGGSCAGQLSLVPPRLQPDDSSPADCRGHSGVVRLCVPKKSAYMS